MVGDWVGEGVEDSFAWGGAWFEDSCWLHVFEVGLAHVQDVRTGEEVFDEDVAFLIEAAAHFREGRGGWGDAHPAYGVLVEVFATV